MRFGLRRVKNIPVILVCHWHGENRSVARLQREAPVQARLRLTVLRHHGDDLAILHPLRSQLNIVRIVAVGSNLATEVDEILLIVKQQRRTLDFPT